MREGSLPCKICGHPKAAVVYQGPIRAGKFGHLSRRSYRLRKCGLCGVIALPRGGQGLREYYERGAYRRETNGSATAAHYELLHKAEQDRYVNLVKTADFRGRVVADVGCGTGLFLDRIKAQVRQAIAIEPSLAFRKRLLVKRYHVYGYVQEALKKLAGKVELAVSFSVLEHVKDPLPFLREIRSLLHPKGKLMISTPNADDLLIRVLPVEYSRFFYRKAHLWYFNATALRNLLTRAGFKRVRVIPHQRFGFGNFLCWLKDKMPMGDVRLRLVPLEFDGMWKKTLEENLCNDYLFAEAFKA